ncbi:hypothetical protein RHSIM_Rhsim08G0189300 [Rhododendron simsii]|uniref:DET1- and DDB1-associated protein 1 domain-containing protein n=1 Tax=Rhododendron simsii TaxID=118357 RepID=A0A834GJV4_RHOSS|nr:hypothetical protein RHSIM_Rhsim08G0189300 [Rhododendron simsii]
MAGSSAPTSDSNPQAAGGGASKYLANLPSRGLFSSTVLSSNPVIPLSLSSFQSIYLLNPSSRKFVQGGMRVYICDHDTAPPDDQLIKTNQTNILIRSLMLKKQKGDSSSKDIKGASPSEASRKRPAERALDGRASTKRGATNNQAGSRQEGSRTRVPEKDFQSLTVERLRALLKEKGLSRNGKKAKAQMASHSSEVEEPSGSSNLDYIRNAPPITVFTLLDRRFYLVVRNVPPTTVVFTLLDRRKVVHAYKNAFLQEAYSSRSATIEGSCIGCRKLVSEI